MNEAYQELVNLFKAKNPRIVVIVGTGVSLGATSNECATWRGLLTNAVTYLQQIGRLEQNVAADDVKQINAAFDPFCQESVLELAQYVVSCLCRDTEVYRDWLSQSVGHLSAKPQQTDTLQAIVELVRIGSLIATTNYDSLLSHATGLNPVVWSEQNQLSQTSLHEKKSVLHLHGHWGNPSSVILSHMHYSKITQDEIFQEWFKSLWLTNHWVFVGCGAGGVGDPNLGMLLKWANRWEKSEKTDFIFVHKDEVQSIQAVNTLPKHLKIIELDNFADLAPRLRQLVTLDVSPFLNVHDDRFNLYGLPEQGLLFPTREEYLDQQVPTFAVDLLAIERLQQHRYACIIDRPSTGKTTLALRIANQLQQRSHAAYYLDCADIDEDSLSDINKALRRLDIGSSLFIIDNIHHQASLARKLWDHWRNMTPSNSRLLLIATDIDSGNCFDSAKNLDHWRKDPINPSLNMGLEANDLLPLFNRVNASFDPNSHRLNPPAWALQEWFQHYGAALAAFPFALQQHWNDIRAGQWRLPKDAAVKWVKEKWLDKRSQNEKANLALLSFLGAQELELTCPVKALPFPEDIANLLKHGLVRQISIISRANKQEFQRYKLSEPSWGELFIAAMALTEQNLTELLLTTTEKSISIGLNASIKLLRANKHLEITAAISSLIFQTPADKLIDQLLNESNLNSFISCVNFFRSHNQNTKLLWVALETDKKRLEAAMWNNTLDNLASFIDVAKKQGQDTALFWQLLVSDETRLTAAISNIQLHLVAAFINSAQNQGQDTALFWQLLVSDESRLTAAMCNTPLDLVAAFMDVAMAHGQNTALFWQLLADTPQLTAAIWNTSLAGIATFLQKAKSHKIDTSRFWQLLVSDESRLTAAICNTPLDLVAVFMDVAMAHGQNTALFWEWLKSVPQRLTAAICNTQLHLVASFMDVAIAHSQNTALFWEWLESNTQRFSNAMREIPLLDLAVFIDKAKRHHRNTELYWQWLGNSLQQFKFQLQRSPLQMSVGFFSAAPDQHLIDCLKDLEPSALNLNPQQFNFGLVVCIAERLINIGLLQHAEYLIVRLLERSKPQDFPATSSGTTKPIFGFYHAALVLLYGELQQQPLLDQFQRHVFNAKFIHTHFKWGSLQSLAKGLYTLALNPEWLSLKQLVSVHVIKRLETELAQVTSLDNEQLLSRFQLLGAAFSLKIKIRRERFCHISPETVAILPVDILPHRIEAEPDAIEIYQLLLWLGIRAYAEATEKTVAFSIDLLEETHRRLCARAKQFESNSVIREHELATKMVSWLYIQIRRQQKQTLKLKEKNSLLLDADGCSA